jgi:N-acetylmuramoyl-L-alanine amidase
LPVNPSEGVYYLKLRSSYHPEFLRIVLEGEEYFISKGTVNQKGDDIIVRFPQANLILRAEKARLPYKVDNNTIVFSPGSFSKFKAFSLKFPSRLVIDVYQKPKKKDVKRSIDALRNKWRGLVRPPARDEQPKKIARKRGTKTVVIDPGHGGYESGLLSEKYKEKNVVLDIAKRLDALINRGSNKSFLTRKSDHFISLGERLKFANSKNAEIFLSLHIGKHSEIVLYTPVITEPVPYEAKDFLVNKGQAEYTKKTATLHNSLRQAIEENFGHDMVSIKPLPYSILSEIEAASLIVELPSFDDAQYIADLKTELANTIYKGLSFYEESTAN